jgi:hypothetical protein
MRRNKLGNGKNDFHIRVRNNLPFPFSYKKMHQKNEIRFRNQSLKVSLCQ